MERFRPSTSPAEWGLAKRHGNFDFFVCSGPVPLWRVSAPIQSGPRSLGDKALAKSEDLTVLLQSVSEGKSDPAAVGRVFEIVHAELRRVAAQMLRKERVGHTLQPTALVHEVYLRLVDAKGGGQWEHRAHFFGIAARAMRQVLVDYARERNALKRGGDQERVTLDDRIDAVTESGLDLFELDEALTRLNEKDERTARIVELRFFGGMTEEEVAVALDLSRRTVQREWWMAKMWLRRELSGDRPLAEGEARGEE